MLFTYDVDYLFFVMAESLLKNKEKLYDLSETLTLVYHDKKKLFMRPVGNYVAYFPALKENIGYIEKLFDHPIVPEENMKRTISHYTTLNQIVSSYTLIYTILTFLTL